MILYPLIVAANYKEPVIEFPNYEKIRQSKIQYRPYADEFKKSVPKKIQPLVQKTSIPSHTSVQIGRDYGQGEVQDLIRKYSAEYGISAEAPLCIAKLESGFNANSKNKSSSASGVYQYLDSTWRSTDEGKAGLSVFDADSNVRAAIKYMASRGNARPWTVAKSCPPIKTIN